MPLGVRAKTEYMESFHCGPSVLFSVLPRRWFYYHVRCLQNFCRKGMSDVGKIDSRSVIYICMFATYSRFVCACEITQLLAQNIRNVFCRVRKTRGRLLQMSIRAKLRVAVIPLAFLVLYYYSLAVTGVSKSATLLVLYTARGNSTT